MRLFLIFASLSLVLAQNITVQLTTSSLTITLSASPSGRVVTTAVPDVFNVTHTLTQTSSTPTAPTPSQTQTQSPTIVLATKVTPAFAVLGVILTLTGIPSAFWGHKNRWTSFFLIGFYTLALVCAVLILKFGVLPAINPPSQTLCGMFVLSATIAGVAGGAIAIFFWKAARYAIGAWGGFAFALWIQSFHNGGVIRSMGFRWILYIGCAVLGFTLCTIPKIHYHVLLISTAFVGASSFMLGVDCFTTAGLKEFYIWNIGFPTLFPKFTDNGIQFPVSQTMQIELGLIGAVALMGTAVQFRILKVLQRKLREIAEEMRKKDEEAEAQATDRFNHIAQERDAWEKDHPSLLKHGRYESSTPSKEGEDSPSPMLNDSRPRHPSGISDFKVAPTSDEDLKRASRVVQTPGALPALDLGQAIQEDVPSTFMAKSRQHRVVESLSAELEEFKRKEELLAEIQTIRRSIDVLKSETPVPSSSEPSRRPSFASRRTLSIDASTVLLPTSHSRPPRAIDPRVRVHSMEMSALARSTSGDSIIRPTSVPPKESDWDNYIQERRLLQPPAGVTPPIATIPSLAAQRVPLSPAVQDALTRRKRRESTLGLPPPSTDSSEDTPLAKVVQQKPNALPVIILPPRRSSGPIIAPIPQMPPNIRTRTFEELNERHREKLRDMQAPLTQAEKEHAELEAARQRWERSKALEKEAVTRRQAEKAAALEKRIKSGSSPVEHEGRPPLNEHRSSRHSRSLSADKLANFGTSSSRRLSTLKVEDWQRYQQDAEMGKAEHTGNAGGSSSKRDSRKTKTEGVPFPNDGRGRRSKSRDF